LELGCVNGDISVARQHPVGVVLEWEGVLAEDGLAMTGGGSPCALRLACWAGHHGVQVKGDAGRLLPLTRMPVVLRVQGSSPEACEVSGVSDVGWVLPLGYQVTPDEIEAPL
jgi:hypothetical protein